MIYRTQEELDAALALWQKRLSLQDWKITAEFMGFDNPLADGGGSLARVMRMSMKQRARILMLHPDDIRFTADSIYTSKDMEESLVHELIHVPMFLFEPQDEESTEWKLCERFVDSMARAVINLVRENQPTC